MDSIFTTEGEILPCCNISTLLFYDMVCSEMAKKQHFYKHKVQDHYWRNPMILWGLGGKPLGKAWPTEVDAKNPRGFWSKLLILV